MQSARVIEMDSNLAIRYWTQRLCVSRHALDLAVQAVGADADDVERFIDRARGQCARARATVAASGARVDAHLAIPSDVLEESLRLPQLWP